MPRGGSRPADASTPEFLETAGSPEQYLTIRFSINGSAEPVKGFCRGKMSLGLRVEDGLVVFPADLFEFFGRRGLLVGDA